MMSPNLVRIDLALPLEPGIRSVGARRRGVLSDLLFDPVLVATLVMALILAAGFVAFDSFEEREFAEVQERARQAVRDSAALVLDMERADNLRASREAIASRLDAVKRIDQNRYAFVHLMDHLAASLVAEIYIVSMETVSQDPVTGRVTVRITGVAPNDEAIYMFGQNLEDSPFAARVSVEHTTGAQINRQDVRRFTMTADSELPDISFLSTQIIDADGVREGQAPESYLLPRNSTLEGVAPDAAGVWDDSLPGNSASGPTRPYQPLLGATTAPAAPATITPDSTDGDR